MFEKPFTLFSNLPNWSVNFNLLHQTWGTIWQEAEEPIYLRAQHDAAYRQYSEYQQALGHAFKTLRSSIKRKALPSPEEFRSLLLTWQAQQAEPYADPAAFNLALKRLARQLKKEHAPILYQTIIVQVLSLEQEHWQAHPPSSKDAFYLALLRGIVAIAGGEQNPTEYLRQLRFYQPLVAPMVYEKVLMLVNTFIDQHHQPMQYELEALLQSPIAHRHYRELFHAIDDAFGLIPEKPERHESIWTSVISAVKEIAYGTYEYAAQHPKQMLLAAAGLAGLGIQYAAIRPFFSASANVDFTQRFHLDGLGPDAFVATTFNHFIFPMWITYQFNQGQVVQFPGLSVGLISEIFFMLKPVNSHLTIENSPRHLHARVIGSEFQINNYTSSNQYQQVVTTLNNGNALVIWNSYGQDGSGDGIYGQIIDPNGNKVGVEFRINTYTNNDQRTPAVAALKGGGAIVAWESDNQDGSVEGVFGQIIDNLGNKVGSELQINTQTNSIQSFPAVAGLENGNAIVTWQSYNQDLAGTSGIFGQIVSASGSKLGGEFQVNSYVTNEQLSPTAAGLSNGNALVTWDSNGQDGSSYGIYGQIIGPSGSKIGNEFQVNTNTTNSQYDSAAASLVNGNAIVTWMSYGQDGSSHGIYGQVLNATGGKIGNEFRANTEVISDQSYPAVTALNNLNALLIWLDDHLDGSNNGIFAQFVNTANNQKIGIQFQVNTYTAGDQRDPAVTTLNDGNILATWTSNGQDGSGNGIYGKIIDTHTIAVNANQTISYLQNTPQDLMDISITLPVFLTNVNTTLILSNPLAGSLTTGTVGNTTSTYTINSGTWLAFGNIMEVNALLAAVQFVPTSGFYSNFSLAVRIDDGFNPTLNGTIAFTGSPLPTTSANPTTTTALPTTSISPTTPASTQTPTDTSSAKNDQAGAIAAGATIATLVSISLCALASYGLFACSKRRQSNKRQDPSRPATDVESMSSSQNFPMTGHNSLSRVESTSLAPLNLDIVSPSIPISAMDKIEHKKVLDRYELLTRMTEAEVEAFRRQTGIFVKYEGEGTQRKVKLGDGNFGTVRIAFDLRKNEFIAVKKISESPEPAKRNPQWFEQACNEGILHKELTEKQLPVVPLYDYAFLKSAKKNKLVVYHFMKYMTYDVATLIVKLNEIDNKINYTPRFKQKLLHHIVRSIVLVISSLQKQQIYHLDIKPNNFLVDQVGNIYASDFGCVHRGQPMVTDYIMGDMKYFSPERMAHYRYHYIRVGNQCQCQETASQYDASKDNCWALGITLLEIITGKCLFNTRLEADGKANQWNMAYYARKIHHALEQLPKDDLLTLMIKGLLEIDPEKRLSIKAAENYALTFPKFDEDTREQQISAFKLLADIHLSDEQLEQIYRNNLPREQNMHYSRDDFSDIMSHQIQRLRMT